jgi:glucokinase
MGSFVGGFLADFALMYRATGGIYLTGSVSLALSEYWAEQTDFKKAFVRRGSAEHQYAPWLEPMLKAVPIYLMTDPHVATSGALALASLSP